MEYLTLRKKCHSEFFWSTFYRIRTEYGDLESKSLYSIRVRENVDQKHSLYGHFSRSVSFSRRDPDQMELLTLSSGTTFNDLDIFIIRPVPQNFTTESREKDKFRDSRR